MPSTVSQYSAFGASVARYARTVAPVIDRELARWRQHAETIPDPALREHALENLRDAAAHVQVAGLILTLAPRPHRARAVVAAVALEVAFDYLDTLTEQPTADPVGNGHRLYRTFAFAVGGPAPADPLDDGGYLLALATACRLAFLALPAACAVSDEAQRVARLCGEAQTRTHAVDRLGPDQLADWARTHPIGGLLWWETAAGWCASVLAIHALIAAAANPASSSTDASAIVAAYLHISALTTLLDSLKDRAADQACGAHSFVGYYRSDAAVGEALARVALDATASCALTLHPAHDVMTVAGCAAFYCSGIDDAVVAPLLGELRPVVTPILAMFVAWRTSSRLRH